MPLDTFLQRYTLLCIRMSRPESMGRNLLSRTQAPTLAMSERGDDVEEWSVKNRKQWIMGSACVALSLGVVACEEKKSGTREDTTVVEEAPSGEVTPQDASKATTPTTAEDLKLFTADLGTGTLRATIVTSMGALNCEFTS